MTADEDLNPPPPDDNDAPPELASVAFLEGRDDPNDAIPILPTTFYDQRPVLQHIRQAAHSRMRAADGVLHAVLARTAAMIDPDVRLPPITGSHASLNFFAALVAPSGGGKSTSIDIARDLVPGDQALMDRPIGSGEGLAELYMGVVEADGKKIRTQTVYRAFVTVDEGEALFEMSSRRGTTIMPTLRTAWSGGTLGQSNGSVDNTRFVQAHKYRLGMVIGLQPQSAGRLLADATGGTPQRFTYAAAVGRDIPRERPSWPGDLSDRFAPGPGRMDFTVNADVRQEIELGHFDRARGAYVGSELDSHADLLRLKIAALLAVLDGRLAVTPADWEIGCQVYATSVRVRTHILDLAHAQLRREEDAETAKVARREFAVQAARDSSSVVVEHQARRVALAVYRAGDSLTRTELRECFNSRNRHLVDPSIVKAVEMGWLVVVEGKRYGPGPSRPSEP